MNWKDEIRNMIVNLASTKNEAKLILIMKIEEHITSLLKQQREELKKQPRDYSCIDCSAPLGRSCKRCQTLWES